jgi:hypothetical protein
MDNSKMTDLQDYLDLADAWTQAMMDGDSGTANAICDRVEACFQTLCEMNLEEDMFNRADQAGDGAVFFIASHLKRFDKARAISIYRRLLKSAYPFIAISSKYILKEMGLS